MADYIYEHLSTWVQPKESDAKFHAKKSWDEAKKATGAAANQAKDSMQEMSFEAWLAAQDMAGQGYEYAKEKGAEGAEYLREKGAEGAEYAKEKGAEGAEYLREKGAEGAEYAKEKGAEGAEYAKERGAESAEYARKKAEEGARYARAKAGEGAEYARYKAGEGADYARYKAGEGAGYAQAKAGEGAKYAQKSAESAKNRVVEGANDVYEMLRDRREANARRLRKDLETTWNYFSNVWEGAKDKAARQADWAKGYMEGKAQGGRDSVESSKEGIESLYAKVRDNAAWGIGYFQGQLDEIDSTLSSTSNQATDWAGGVGEWMNSWLITAKDKAEGALERAKVEQARMSHELQDMAQAGTESTKATKDQVVASIRDTLASFDRAARAAHQAAKEDTARANQYIQEQRKQLHRLKGEMDQKAITSREEALHQLEEAVKQAEVRAKEAVGKAKRDRAEGERLLKSGGKKAWVRLEQLMDEQTDRAWVAYDHAVREVNDRAGNLRNEANYLGDTMRNAWSWLTTGWRHATSCKAREIQDQVRDAVGSGRHGGSAMVNRMREAQEALRSQSLGEEDTYWDERMGGPGYGSKSAGLFGTPQGVRHEIPRYLDGGSTGSQENVVSYTYAFIMTIAIIFLALRSYRLQKGLKSSPQEENQEGDHVNSSRARRHQRRDEKDEKMAFIPDNTNEADMQSHRSLKKHRAVEAQGDVMWAGALLIAFAPLAFLETSGASRWFLCIFAAMQLLSLWARMRGQALENPQMLRTSKTLLHASLVAQAMLYLWHWAAIKVVSA